MPYCIKFPELLNVFSWEAGEVGDTKLEVKILKQIHLKVDENVYNSLVLFEMTDYYVNNLFSMSSIDTFCMSPGPQVDFYIL